MANDGSVEYGTVEDLDSFSLYLKEVGRVCDRAPLLSREEEVELARAGTQEARERLVEANLRYAITYAKSYRGTGVSIEDLVSRCNEGLVIAAQHYDPSFNVKFISYAVNWMRRCVLESLAEAPPVRIPAGHYHKQYKLRRLEQTLEQDIGRRPTSTELAQEMGVKKAVVDDLKRTGARAVALPHLHTSPNDKKLGAAVALPDGTFVEPEDPLEVDFNSDGVEGVRNTIARALSNLSERHRKVVILYYGLDDGEGMTLEQLGALMGVTRERVRQILQSAREKLEKDPELRELLP